MQTLAPFQADSRSLTTERQPGPQPAERLEIDLIDFGRKYSALRSYISSNLNSFWGPVESDVPANARAFLATGFEHLKTRAESAFRPATKAEIAKYLAVLVGSLAGNKVDMALYGAALHEDVSSLQPTVGAVEAGCRTLRRTATWVPSIPEVLDAIRAAEAKFDQAKILIGNFPEKIAEIDKSIESAKERRRALDAEERQDRKSTIRRALDRGEDISTWKFPPDPELVSEVKAEIEAFFDGIKKSEGEPF